MSTKHHHAEWLSLIEVSGPFLSMPLLERVFRQGLDAHDPEHFSHLRLAFDEWEDNQSGHRPNPAIHKAWIDFVLKQTLGLPDEVLAEGQAVSQTLKATIAEHGEVLRPDAVVQNPKGVDNAGKARLLIQTYPLDQNLEKAVAGKHWKASPATRMMELLHATDVRLGLVTNGERWMLVDAPKGDTTGFASWYATLWFEENVTLRAFRTLLGVSRFFSVADEDTLEAMLVESAKNQQEVTDQLGLQVRRAVEVLIQSLDRADQDHGRALLADVPETVLYEAALTVMMRLVFLFSAEERELLLLGDPLFDQHYAVSTLVAQLQEAADQHGEEVLERRLDAWVRLLSTFRAVYGGVRHERMKLIPYAGNLFNPDRFPFLEGRKPRTTWRTTPATPLPINNRTVLHLLRSLQFLQMQGEARRLSFRALDIEQIGHVYEGLLDHTAKRAPESMLGLAGAKGTEPEVPLAELERLQATGEADLLAYLNEETGRQEKTLKKALATPLDGEDAKKLRAVCGNDDALFQRVRPFSGLLRNDTFDRPVVIRKGSVFVTAGTDRRSSGTHYTPRSLTEPIVQYTLEPLVYVGPAEGKPKEEWKLRPAKELLDLKICDMACGSGAFLVQACRYLSERLLEAWEDEERTQPGRPRIAPEGKRSAGDPTEKILEGVEDREVDARRLIAQRCLYGVDKNPLAVEMAKLSLWLLTLAKDKPFEFLDHAIRCGDSLVGISNIEQLRSYSLQPDEPNSIKFSGPLDAAVDEAISLRLKLEGLPSNTVEDVERQEQLLREASDKIARLRCAADLLVAGEFWGENPKDKAERVRHNAVRSGHYVENGPTEEFERVAAKDRRGQLMFHWPLEYPEVLVNRGGFDAFIGNPPFIGNKYWQDRLPKGFQQWASVLIQDTVGKSDVVALFFRRAYSLLCMNGKGGLIATTTSREGDTLRIGFKWIAQHGGIYRALSQQNWPGEAGVHFCIVWFGKVPTKQAPILDDHPVTSVSPSLTSAQPTDPPHRLGSSLWAFKGSDNSQGSSLIVEFNSLWYCRLKNAGSPFLRAYITGEDITSGTYLSPPRYVVDCLDASLEEVQRQCPLSHEFLLTVVKPNRTPEVLSPYPGMSERWWQMCRHRAPLYRQVRQDCTCLAIPVVAKHVDVVELPTGYVFTNKVCVVRKPSHALRLIMLSSLFDAWIVEHGGTMRVGTLTITIEKCLETIPPIDQDVPSAPSAISDWYGLVSQVLSSNGGGFTDLFNAMHNSGDNNEATVRLRSQRASIDRLAADLLGLSGLDLGHDFHETKQGVRFTLSEPARREVLQRLLKLNHERYAEEVKRGLHEKKKPKKPSSGRGRKSSAPTERTTLFGNDDDEPDPADDDTGEEETTTRKARTQRSAPRASREEDAEPSSRPTPIDELDTDDIMAAFRQATRGRGWLERDELMKAVSVVLGYQRLGPKIEESLRGHLRAAIRRRIIETDGASLVRAGTGTMADYGLDELRETFRSVMRKGTNYEREDVIHALAHYLGFTRVTDTSRDAIKSAINSAIRQGILGYEGSVVWREE
jgi:hypothetical protein